MSRTLPAGVMCVLIVAVSAGCRTRSTGPAPPIVTPPSVTSAALEVDLGEGQTLADPIVYENLAVYPVRAAVKAEVAEYLTLDEALAEGLIEVTETEGGDVDHVLVTNHAALPVYLMAGEVILGGKQDRVVAKDTVVSAGANDVEVRVFCVEQGRWHGDTIAFKQSGLQASTAVRKAAQLYDDQGAVWERVAGANRAAGAEPATGAYRAGASESEVAKKAQAYVDAIVPTLASDREALGVVVAVDGEVVSADVYSSQALFQKLHEKLLAAHARDAAESVLQGQASNDAPARGAAATFLSEARQGTEVGKHKGGAAEMMQLEAERSVGFRTEAPAADGGPADEMMMLHENYYQSD